jgi:ATP diphosphatase
VRTVRGRADDGLVARQACDAHVQEAAKGQPQQRYENPDGQIEGQHRWSVGSPRKGRRSRFAGEVFLNQAAPKGCQSPTITGNPVQYTRPAGFGRSRDSVRLGTMALVENSGPGPARLDGTADSFVEAVAIMARLRGPDGCPWDREQDFDSIRKYTLEETYEVFDAIERRDWMALKDELGDLLLQVLFYTQMASDAGYFTIEDVIRGLSRKLVRRHPHVFGPEAAAAAGNSASGLNVNGIDAKQVLRNWEEIKKLEKAEQTSEGRLDEVSRSMPALSEAAKLGSKAAKVGFDWPEASGLFDKLREETAELEAEVPSGEHTSGRAKEELGDLLFTAVNLARHLKIDPELALRDANAKFRSRFRSMETNTSRPLEELSTDELEALWIAAKQKEGPA